MAFLGLGVLALAPGLYGLWGLSVVVGDWLACQDGRLAMVAAPAVSYPSGFCETSDWARSFGIGFALLGVGLAGVVAIIASLRHPALGERS